MIVHLNIPTTVVHDGDQLIIAIFNAVIREEGPVNLYMDDFTRQGIPRVIAEQLFKLLEEANNQYRNRKI